MNGLFQTRPRSSRGLAEGSKSAVPCPCRFRPGGRDALQRRGVYLGEMVDRRPRGAASAAEPVRVYFGLERAGTRSRLPTGGGSDGAREERTSAALIVTSDQSHFRDARWWPEGRR